MTAAPAAENQRPRSRLGRHFGTVSLAQREPTPMVALLSEGFTTWLSATRELVEQASVLAGLPIEALVIHVADQADMAAGVTLTGRLVRIDPASGAPAPDAATRTRDMLRDWDEVLHRLAR